MNTIGLPQAEMDIKIANYLGPIINLTMLQLF